MSHKELVEKARIWLQGQGCNPIFTEKGSQRICEFPDAIGWDAHNCIVVECKVSVADLHADKNKDCRVDGEGMGNKRYFLIPQGLENDALRIIPTGWGLVIAWDNGTTSRPRFKDSKDHGRNLAAELAFMRSRILEIQRFGT